MVGLCQIKKTLAHCLMKDLANVAMMDSWIGLFEQFGRDDVLYSFFRIVVTFGKRPTAYIICHGTRWRTSKQTDLRMNLTSWAGDIHYLIYENDAWRILAKEKNATNRSEFGLTPLPRF